MDGRCAAHYDFASQRGEKEREEREQSHFQDGQSSHRLMECNRTLAQSPPCPLISSFCHSLSPSLPPSLFLYLSFCSPPHVPPTHPHFSLCPRALFLLRDMYDRGDFRSLSPRYFKSSAPAPAFISAAFILICVLPYLKLVSCRAEKISRQLMDQLAHFGLLLLFVYAIIKCFTDIMINFLKVDILMIPGCVCENNLI